MTREHTHVWQQLAIATVAGLPLACLVAGLLVLTNNPAPRTVASQLAMWLSAAIWVSIIGAAPFFQRRRIFVAVLLACYAFAGAFFWISRT